jgi:hypothetical protein
MIFALVVLLGCTSAFAQLNGAGEFASKGLLESSNNCHALCQAFMHAFCHCMRDIAATPSSVPLKSCRATPDARICCPCLTVTPQLLQTLLSNGGLEGMGEGQLSTIISGLREVVSDDEEGKYCQSRLPFSNISWLCKYLPSGAGSCCQLLKST